MFFSYLKKNKKISNFLLTFIQTSVIINEQSRERLINKGNAEVAELADAHGSGPCGSDTMRVQVPLSASHGGDRKVAAFVVSEKYNTKPGKGRKPWQLIEETKRRQTGHRKYTRTGTNWICRPSYTRPYREEIFLPFIVCPFF